MNINKEQIDDLNLVVSMQIGKDDYESKVNEILRDYRRKANMPGFRPGKVPEGLIRKMYGKAVLIDEINKLVSESLTKYIEEQDLKTLGNPLPKFNGDEMDWEIGNDFTFDFDMGLAPEIAINLSKDDQINKYQIIVEQDLIEKEIEHYANRFGQYVDVDVVEDFSEKLIGNIVQLGEDGQPLEDGLSAEDSSLLLSVIKDDECKKLFENAKAGDETVFNLSQAFPNEWEIASILKKKDKNEVGDISGSLFRYNVKTIQKHVNAELNQELFDKVFGENAVSGLEEFKNRIRENIASDYEETCFSQFNVEMRKYLLNKYNPTLPEEFLLKWMKSANQDVNEEVFEKEFPQFLENMKWELIANALIKQHELKVDEQEVIDAAKDATFRQFSMYGMKNIPDEFLTQQAMNLLKDEKSVRNMASQAMERKSAKAVSEIVDLNIQEVSMDDFNQIIYGSQLTEENEETGETGETGEIVEAGEVEVVEKNETVEETGTVENIVEIIEPEKPKKSKKRVKNESE